MNLSCQNPQQVVVKYTTVKPTRISCGTDHFDGAVPMGVKFPQTAHDFQRFTAPNPDAELTWEFVPHPEYHYLEWDVNVQLASTAFENNSFDFKVYLADANISVGYWVNDDDKINFAITSGDPPVTENFPAPIRPSYSHPGYTLVNESIVGHDPYKALFISIGGSTIHDTLGYAYDWNVYADGEFYGTFVVRSNDPPPLKKSVYVEEGYPGNPASDLFLIEDNPDFVELVKVEGQDYKYQLIKKFLDNEPDDQEQIFYEFYGIDPYLLCFANQDDCPDGTCKVDCGTHYCCYPSDGIAVHSFLK